MAKGKFKISPHVVRQLGAELVTDQVTALMELIKNSYDADASYVKVTINTQESYTDSALYYPSHKGYIIVEDNGCGMDENTITNSWLTISYSNKRAVNGVKKVSKKGRTPLGDKGLGRLSTQRLANICEIMSKPEGKTAVHAGFDWRSFDSAKSFSDVDVPIESFEWKKDHGTKLMLLDLIDVSNSWNDEGLTRFKAMLCQLVSPYSELRPFNVYVSVDGQSIDLEQEMSKLTLAAITDITFEYKDKVMTIEADISPRKLIGTDGDTYRRIIECDGGMMFCQFFLGQKKSKNFKRAEDRFHFLHLHTSLKLYDVKPQSLFDPIIDPGDFTAKIREYSFGRDDSTTMSWSQLFNNFNTYKTFVQQQRGIKLFRDGFAIRPYGIDGQDWLDLSSGQTSGASFYGLRPGNVIGYVAISEGVNVNLKDKTDREGLVDNDYYIVFRDLLKQAVVRLNQEFNILRRGYNEFKKQYAQNNQKIKTLEQAYAEIAKQGDYAVETSSDYKQIQEQFTRIQQRLCEVKFAEFDTFEGSNYREVVSRSFADIEAAVVDTQKIFIKIEKVLEKSNLLNEVLVILRPKLDRLEEQLTEFSELASLGLISEMVSHDLGQIAARLIVKGQSLEKALKSSQEIDRVMLYGLVEYIKSTCSSIQNHVKHLDSSLKYTREKKECVSVARFLKDDELPYYTKVFSDKNIETKLLVKEDFKVTFNSGKLIQVFDNLINNSIYWLNFFNIEKPEINIRIEKPWVIFSDNGKGVDESVEESLFEPFMTCKPVGKGRGLGLFIIRQMLEDYGSSISLAEDRNQYGRRFRFVINLTGLL